MSRVVENKKKALQRPREIFNTEIRAADYVQAAAAVVRCDFLPVGGKCARGEKVAEILNGTTLIVEPDKPRDYWEVIQRR